MIGFGFRRFANYRIRVLLYAGKPNGTYSPRSHPAELRRARSPTPRWRPCPSTVTTGIATGS